MVRRLGIYLAEDGFGKFYDFFSSKPLKKWEKMQKRHNKSPKSKLKFTSGVSWAQLMLLLAGFGLLVGLAPAQAANSTPDKPASAPAAPQPAPVPAVNPVTQAAVKAGVLTSVSLINKVMGFLTGNAVSGAFLFMPKVNPDQSIFSASLEIQSPAGAPIYASASFAPLPTGGAGAVYDTVEYSDKSIDYLEKNIFKGLKRVGVVRKDIVVLDAGSVKIFLMPAGSGTVVIKKEVVQ